MRERVLVMRGVVLRGRAGDEVRGVGGEEGGRDGVDVVDEFGGTCKASKRRKTRPKGQLKGKDGIDGSTEGRERTFSNVFIEDLLSDDSQPTTVCCSNAVGNSDPVVPPTNHLLSSHLRKVTNQQGAVSFDASSKTQTGSNSLSATSSTPLRDRTIASYRTENTYTCQ